MITIEKNVGLIVTSMFEASFERSDKKVATSLASVRDTTVEVTKSKSVRVCCSSSEVILLKFV